MAERKSSQTPRETSQGRSLVATIGIGVAAAVLGFATVWIAAKRPEPPSLPAGGSPSPAAGAINPLSTGHMAAFVFKKQPEALAEIAFQDASGTTRSLKDWAGKVVLLNLWATWCAPCRKEMPALDRLQKELGSDTFEVVALSVDKSGIEGAQKFLDSIKISALKTYADPSARVGGHLKAAGMPTTLLLDRQGREIGRLTGPAEWDSGEAKALIASALR